MKKALLLKPMLLLFALIVGSSSVWAEDPELTLNFTSAWTAGSDNSDGEKVFTKTIGSDTYTISGKGGANFKFSSGYFIFGKSGAYIKLPKVDYDVDKIVVIGNGSGSAAVKMNLFVGNTAVSTETTGCGEGTNSGTASTLTYNIAEGYQSANTQYILKVTSSHNAQITYVKYYKKTGGPTNAVSIPIFNPGTNTYNAAQEVEISCGTTGASIYYTMTTNGTTPADPTEQSSLYSSAIPVTKTGTIIKAKAFKTGMDASSVATATYTIQPNAPTIVAAGSTITITGDEGCTIYYTTNGNNPTNESTEYTEPFTLDADCTIKAIAYDTYGNSSSVKSLTFKNMPLSPKNINSGYFEKVTDVSTLENGDAILIVCEDDEVAMSTEQKNNNRGQADVTISEGIIYAPSQDVQKLVLVMQNEKIDDEDTDVFYFYTGSGYLYAASGSSNHLKTEASPDNNNNARATISISSGNATILFTGTNARRWLKHNGNETNGSLFSCYATSDESMHIVQIYKEVAASVPASITAAGYATFSSFTNVDFSANENLTVFTAKQNGTSITLTEVDSKKVPANTAVILKGEGGDFNGTVVATADALENNDLQIAEEDMNGSSGKIYVLNKVDGVVGFYKLSANGTLTKGKAYLEAESEAPYFGFDAEGTTGIQNIERTINDNQYYTLDGRRVAEPTKGIYIINGKKVVIK